MSLNIGCTTFQDVLSYIDGLDELAAADAESLIRLIESKISPSTERDGEEDCQSDLGSVAADEDEDDSTLLESISSMSLTEASYAPQQLHAQQLHTQRLHQPEASYRTPSPPTPTQASSDTLFDIGARPMRTPVNTYTVPPPGEWFRKLYVVTVGREVGIFCHWDKVSALVRGVSGGTQHRINDINEGTRLLEDAICEGRLIKVAT